MNRTKLLSIFAVLATFVIYLVGCATGLDNAPGVNNLLGGHPTEWAKTHWSGISKKSGGCETCHGSITNKELAGGISKVSCFSCHINGVKHTPGFADPARHGKNSAQMVPDTEPILMTGFVTCQMCHGDDYRGGHALSCMTCHTKAPHPDKPWHVSSTDPSWSASAVTHNVTAEESASACVQCHKDGANSTLVPKVPPLPDAPPGCFNNTLCHPTMSTTR
ncbi:MAG: hypothetical protein LBH03_02790 [Holophagales bacterium]|jgi:hypothetical protein|nr:hypothetical protein [Holophagales bacterium]